MKKTIERRALEWLQSGNVCMASEAMVYAALGIKRGDCHPISGASLKRCFLAARRVGLDDSHLSRVAKLSPEWKSIVENWSELKRLMNRDHLGEVGDRMRQIGAW